jgi:Cu/Ag efflux protein CusF
MKTLRTLSLAVLAALSTSYAGAQSTPTVNTAHLPATATKSSASQAVLTPGEIKKIDRTTQRVTLQHGAITNLGMPAMTMVFRAQDPSALSRLNVGDKVRFHAEESDGGLLLTRIEKAAP